ncbi:uncharacterized protein EV154DRAFT_486170 [Mucor mucedo]|uniref:uncharacterized protein n=1 Tax=Mucor mucedo TaxID=29922 RepID=UPI00221E997F|nr:uncharacterized protein EV154DRAFT_486170 [Mucor mucedo]KAI7878536.1 hypothetical protein EV154DRAFT_486170 [Mucor mucedo]
MMQQFHTTIVASLIPSSEPQLPLLTAFANFVFMTGVIMPRTIMFNFLGSVPDTRRRVKTRSFFVLPTTIPADINEEIVAHSFFGFMTLDPRTPESYFIMNNGVDQNPLKHLIPVKPAKIAYRRHLSRVGTNTACKTAVQNQHELDAQLKGMYSYERMFSYQFTMVYYKNKHPANTISNYAIL